MSTRKLKSASEIDDNDLAGCIMWLRHNGQEVSKMARAKDKDAIGVEASYRALYDDRLNVEKQNEFIRRVKQFVHRELTVAEREEMQRKFGYKVSDTDTFKKG